VELPVFQELDRFLGASRGGGLFEDGDIHGTIANRTLFVDTLTLEGRLLQLHASGSITFDGGLDLQVLVNTRDLIPQSGMAIVSLIPGLGQALGRGEEVILKIASFLENRLLKFRVGGTVGNPTVRLDTGVAVTQGAAGFFSSALKIPIGGRR
jgi:translocation and assembly module TamB